MVVYLFVRQCYGSIKSFRDSVMAVYNVSVIVVYRFLRQFYGSIRTL